ncbi:HD domain-containing phosphohydrolase [Alkaliphilus transvaalensis]|uniref:HD domain-containing phosphohydrolase n=1 Tax=Alkaliphilus transvaalensis TaxID=114628 RepID=UPI00047C26E3|nr:HD domain-containing phosphohydrolase [Alkaliphilus transvaalensis]
MLNRYRHLHKKISHKLFIFLILTSFIPIISLVNVTKISMENQLGQYKQKEINHYQEHFLFNLRKYQDHINLIVYDYSYWEESYEKTATEDIEWLKYNIVDWLPSHFNFSYTAVINPSGSLLLENIEGFYNITSMIEVFENTNFKLQNTSDFILLNDELYMMTLQPIKSEENNNLISGSIIVLEKIDEAFLLEHISFPNLTTNMYVNARLVKSNPNLEKHLENTFINDFDNHLLEGSLYHYIPIKNLNGDLLAYGILEIPYGFYRQAFNTLKGYQISTFLLVLVFFTLAYYFMKKYLLDPINHAREVITEIKLTKKPIPINIYSDDEIGELALSFNELALEINKQHEHLKKLALTDDITSLYNSRYFSEYLDGKIQLEKTFILAILEINFMKSYINLFKRNEADCLLKEIGNAIEDLEAPIAFRLSDATFAVIFNNNDISYATKWVKQFQKSINLLNFEGKAHLPPDLISVSAGISAFPKEAKSKDLLLKLTEEKLHNAKAFTLQQIGSYFSILHGNLYRDFNSYEDIYSIIRILLSVIHSMDQYTLFHSENVTRYALEIGMKLSLPLHQMEELKYGALLHDIGKLQLGSVLLNKVGKLTEEEIEHIKLHPLHGVNILCSIPKLQDILPIIKHHHEWYNGEGYPYGLKETDIPLLARIVSVADAYDSMTTRRPYRSYSKTHEEAISELLRCSGTQFDPEVVDVFIKSASI